MGNDTTTPQVNEENIPDVLWIIFYILRGESGTPDSYERSQVVIKLQEAIHWLYADQLIKNDKKERERLAQQEKENKE